MGVLRVAVHGDDLPVPAGRQRALIAALAIRPRVVVSADRLIDIVWGDDLPANPTNALQVRISQLRKVVGAERVAQRGNGYLLQISDADLDASRFEQLADRGHQLLIDQRWADASAVLSEALDLWRGEALEEFADEDWARTEAARLDERRAAAQEDRFEAELALGRHARLVGELETAVAAAPFRERLRGQLMVALYRSGRQADALHVFADTRRVLDEELGLQPGPELRRLEAAVLRHDEALTAPSEASPPRGTSNLPVFASSFVGRESAVTQVGTLVSHSRLVTLTGPGGAGKTRLAVEAAAEFADEYADGARLVELSTLGGLDEIVAAVADASQVVGHAALITGAPTGLDRLTDALRSRQLLLLLDNCEHVITHAAALAAALLAACPTLHILTTSREPLGIRGETIWSVPSLRVPHGHEPAEIEGAPAVRLFLDRFASHRPGLELSTDDLRTVADITRRLDGMPLAVELAAARARVLSLGEIAAGLDDRFALLTTGTRDALPRQRTLWAVTDWSWELLDDTQRRAWAALATFTGHYTLSHAAELLDAAGPGAQRAADLVTDLVDRSVVVADTSRHPARYRMLETIREYGLNRRAELGIEHQVTSAHADLTLRRAETAYPTDAQRWSLDLTAATALLDEALPVLHRAQDRGDRVTVQRLAGNLGWVWWLRGRRDEGLRWLSWSLEEGIVEPRAGLAACRLAVDLPEPPPGIVMWADRAAELATNPIDRVLAIAWGALARIRRGELAAARQELDAVDPGPGQPMTWTAATVTLVRAIAWATADDLDRAAQAAHRARDAFAAASAWPGEMFTADALGSISEALGDLPVAHQTRQQALGLARRHGAMEVEAFQLARLGNLAARAGDLDTARDHHRQALAIAERLGLHRLPVEPLDAADRPADNLVERNSV